MDCCRADARVLNTVAKLWGLKGNSLLLQGQKCPVDIKWNPSIFSRTWDYWITPLIVLALIFSTLFRSVGCTSGPNTASEWLASNSPSIHCTTLYFSWKGLGLAYTYAWQTAPALSLVPPPPPSSFSTHYCKWHTRVIPLASPRKIGKGEVRFHGSLINPGQGWNKGCGECKLAPLLGQLPH